MVKIIDSSGAGLNLIAQGGYSFIEGVVGNYALYLKGSDGCAWLQGTGNPIIPSGSSFSISAWVKPAQDYSIGVTRVVTKLYGSVSSNRAGSLAFNSTTKKFIVCYPTASNLAADLVASNASSVDRWYHVVGIFDNANGDVFLYIDNSLDNSKTDLTADITGYTGTSRFILGTELDTGTPVYFKGAIDEVCCYNRALTSDEVTTLYNKGSVTSGLVAKYSFEEYTPPVGHNWVTDPPKKKKDMLKQNKEPLMTVKMAER